MGYSHQSGADIRLTSYILMIRADDSVQAYYSFSSRPGGKLCPSIRKAPSVINAGLKVNIKLKKNRGFKADYRKNEG